MAGLVRVPDSGKARVPDSELVRVPDSELVRVPDSGLVWVPDSGKVGRGSQVRDACHTVSRGNSEGAMLARYSPRQVSQATPIHSMVWSVRQQANASVGGSARWPILRVVFWP